MAETWYPVSPGLATAGGTLVQESPGRIWEKQVCVVRVSGTMAGSRERMPTQGVPSQRWAGVSQEPQRQRLHDTVALPVPGVSGHPRLCGQSAGPALWSRENQIPTETHDVTGNSHTVIINFPLQSGQRDILPVFVVDITYYPLVSFPFQSYAKQPYILFI